MNYIKLYTRGLRNSLDLASDIVVGRVFKAMLIYAETGKEILTEDGMEVEQNILWDIAKWTVDLMRKAREHNA